MSEDPLGYYILYRQHFGDGGPPLETKVGPIADEDSARRRFKNLSESGDRANMSDFKLVHRHETVLDERD